jgi:protein-disulfide isomerase
MTSPIRLIATATVLAVLTFFAPMKPVHAQTQRPEIEEIIKDYLAKHPAEIERIVKEYLSKNPSVVKEAIVELIKQRRPANVNAAPSIDKSAAIKANAAALFNSTRQVILGNPQGDVTLVEFFDYNCGFCKRALSDMLALMKDDPKLKIVLKEYPVLGPGSAEAARVAVAVRMQDRDGVKYLEFHRKLLSDRGYVDKARALEIANGAGLDMKRLENDMTSDEVRETLAESVMLGDALGIRGTPSYVIGENIVIGAVGMTALNDRIKAVRK